MKNKKDKNITLSDLKMVVENSQVLIMKDVKMIVEKSEEKIMNMVGIGFKEVYERFDGVENRLDKVESRLDGVENKLDSVEFRLDGIDRRLDYHAENYVTRNELKIALNGAK